MSKLLCITLVCILFSTKAFSQSASHSAQLESIENTVTGINTVNYKLVKQQWGLFGKIIIPKGKLKSEFNPLVEKHGVFTIDTIVFSSIYSATAELHSHSKKRIFLRFIFNDKAKLQGLGLGYPTFVYKKNTSVNESSSNDILISRIDSIVKLRLNKKGPGNFNGSILVTEGDSILYTKSTGKLNFISPEEINDSSIFLLASCSKQFTALAIMKLVEAGGINFDDKVNQHLPKFPYGNITVRHLLSHTSGLPSYFPLLAKYWDTDRYVANQDVLDLFIQKQPDLEFTPNERFSYSNTGYIILSLIIEAQSKQTYGSYLKSIIFDPLKMHNTSVYPRRISGDTLKNYAVGNIYSESQKKYILPDSSKNHNYVSYMDGLNGDDGVSSSVLDLKKWNEGLRNNTLISRKMSQLGTSSHVLTNGKETGYGFGIVVKKGKNIQDIEYHTGGWPGYSTMIIRLTELDRNIILLSNNNFPYFDSLLDAIAFLLCE